jgi:general stress protein YciG
MGKQHTSTDTNEDLQPDRLPRPVEGTEPKARRPRGFAAMDRKLVSEIARKGGKAAHSAGTAHEFTTEEAREAGRKGGQASHANRRKHLAESAAPPAVEGKTESEEIA